MSVDLTQGMGTSNTQKAACPAPQKSTPALVKYKLFYDVIPKRTHCADCRDAFIFENGRPAQSFLLATADQDDNMYHEYCAAIIAHEQMATDSVETVQSKTLSGVTPKKIFSAIEENFWPILGMGAGLLFCVIGSLATGSLDTAIPLILLGASFCVSALYAWMKEKPE